MSNENPIGLRLLEISSVLKGTEHSDIAHAIEIGVKEIIRLSAELEREHGRLAACGVAALGYFDGCAEEYKSASLEDVLKLRDEVQRLRALKGGSYSKVFVLELLGYLTGAIPELHAFESGKMISLLEEFEHRHEEAKP